MRLWSRLRSWVRAVARLARMEREMDAELRFHIEAFAEDLVRNGLPSEEALRRARIEFGGMERAKEECRESRSVSFLDSLFQDLRFGLRMLTKAPGFTSVVVLSLALGIGANTAIFTLLDAILFKMLLVKNPQELALLQWAVPDERDRPSLWYDGSTWTEGGEHIGFSFSYPAFEQFRTRNDVLSDVFAFADLGSDMNVVADGEPGLAHAQMASGRIFLTLGVQPVTGRLFEDSDDRPGSPPVCVISGGYWKQRFGARRDIAGKVVVIAGVAFNIVGVTPPSFSGLTAGSKVDVWVPLSTQPLVEPNLDPKVSMFTAADHWWIQIMGRLKPGVSRAQAAAGLDVIFKPTAAEGIHSQPGQRVVIPSIELGHPGQGFGQL